MNDQEILKRMSEICGHMWVNNPDEECWVVREDSDGFHDWNPLTNGSDLVPLIEKYEVTILSPLSYQPGIWCAISGNAVVKNESLPHAILLAIIEAHDEKQVG